MLPTNSVFASSLHNLRKRLTPIGHTIVVKGMVQHHKDGVKIYTDGSLNPTESMNCGPGVHVQHAGEESFNYNIGHRTVYMAHRENFISPEGCVIFSKKFGIMKNV